jgi:hypothetical protein
VAFVALLHMIEKWYTLYTFVISIFLQLHTYTEVLYFCAIFFLFEVKILFVHFLPLRKCQQDIHFLLDTAQPLTIFFFLFNFFPFTRNWLRIYFFFSVFFLFTIWNFYLKEKVFDLIPSCRQKILCIQLISHYVIVLSIDL